MINGDSGICVLCDEAIDDDDPFVRFNAGQQAHHECSMRSVMGGIGHHVAHEYWCVVRQDPDAGFTFRQSAKLVLALVDVIGVDAVTERSLHR